MYRYRGLSTAVLPNHSGYRPLYGSGGRCPFVVVGAAVAVLRKCCPRGHGGPQVDGAAAEISDLIMAVAGVLQSGCGGRRDLDHFYRWGRGGKREAP